MPVASTGAVIYRAAVLTSSLSITTAASPVAPDVPSWLTNSVDLTVAVAELCKTTAAMVALAPAS